MKNTVTIKQIAAEAGVSTATVSRVFNGKDLRFVSEKTRHKVQKIIEKRQYTPNSSAKGLVSGRSKLIGIQIVNVYDPLIASIVAGAERIAGRNGYSLILADSSWRKQKEQNAIESMLEKDVEGIIWMPIYTISSKNLAKKIIKRSCPVVNLENDPGYGFPVVVGDHFQGGRSCAAYCHALGHTRIAFVGPKSDSHSKSRFEGYCDYLTKNEIQKGYSAFCGTYSADDAFKATKVLLKKSPEVTAIICASDSIALGVYRVAQEKGLTFGKDIAVIGYNNRDYSEHLTPPLTSVAIKREEIGAVAMRTLLELINGKKIEKKIVIPHEIIPRQSCGEKKEVI